MTFTSTDRGIKIKDEEAFSAIVAHLNKLEGVDLEPEFLAKSSSGPWEILVSADCAQQYEAKFKDQGVFAIHEVKYPMIVKFQTLDDKARELPQASSKSLAITFKDVTAHLVVRNYKFELKDSITITSLAKALENQGFVFLQGNQERSKVLTKEG
eukprot:scaffold43956_cov23-Tisochrysis_lutea.AAC.1